MWLYLTNQVEEGSMKRRPVFTIKVILVIVTIACLWITLAKAKH